MKSAIWGSGAIGAVVGAGMAAAGEDVLLVDIVPEHVSAMNERGLLIKTADGERRISVRAALPSAVDGRFDFVFLAVKSQHTQGALDAIVPSLKPDSTVVSLQNGVNEPHIARRIGADRTVGCLVDFSADYHAPGEVYRARAGNLFIGELDGAMTPRLAEIHRLCSHSVLTHSCRNIMGFVWAKMCKATVDAMTALVDTDSLKLRSDRTYHPVRVQLLREAIAVAAADGVQVEAFAHFDPTPFVDASPGSEAAAFAALDGMAEGQAKGNTKVRTGYFRDIVVRKRKSEIDHICGEIARRGAQAGIPTPINRLQAQLFAEIESGRRALGWENLETLRAAVIPHDH